MSDNSGEKIEFGESGLIVQPDGTYYNKYTHERFTAEGKVLDDDGETIFDPDDEPDMQ